ncbi:PREDICTED: uncharacterized protein LOC104817673 [Tarenaya hassleriana]|uniref:uncharacterized protein LOC104817673 n=1 Tax=Tarenaya hassleriana TaxID=28532 RepID=UPI00053CA3FF|nr:PREDICTED: uncharacterized protein LOC104817673 [Tarenaya hassleriana]
MEAPAPSFVSKARTAFHSAAAKAERVFTDLKSDRDAEKQAKRNEDLSEEDNEVKPRGWRGANIGTKQEWQDRLKNLRLGRIGVENHEKAETLTMALPFVDENMYTLKVIQEQEAKASDVASLVESLNAIDVNGIPSASTVKQLAVALEAGKRAKTVKDFVTSSGSSSPVRERGALSLSAVKSLVLGDKEDKLGFDPGDEDKLVSLTQALFDAESSFLRRKIDSDLESPASTTSLPKDIHAAPSGSFVVKLAEVIGSFTTLRRMTLFWCRVVDELRRFWTEGKHIPGIPLDEIPDLKFCLLHQWLQVINCCLSRKARRRTATEALDAVMRQSSLTDEDSDVSEGTASSVPLLYAKSNTGELILRLGVNHRVENLTLLETGQPVYAPITQEGPLLTEDLIRETEELVLRTGSMGAGCSQLLSDMQAFKAANPDCTLEDFVRWHSPPDWTENDTSPGEGDSSSLRGRLSTRMQKEGNLWRELWETAKPVPAVKQTPLFDEDLAVEGILNCLEDIPAAELFEQLFVSLVASGFAMSEPRLAKNDDLSKMFYKCKDYVVVTCQGHKWSDKLDDLCQVYETVETMLLRPEEFLRTMKQTEESPTGETRRRFRRLGFIFRGKERGQKKQQQGGGEEQQKGSEGNPNRQSFSSFFDGKSSLFSKRPPKPENADGTVA